MENKTIDLTPTWSGLLPAILALLQDGSSVGQKEARTQLGNMARAADLGVKAQKALIAAAALLEKYAPLDKDEHYTPEERAEFQEAFDLINEATVA